MTNAKDQETKMNMEQRAAVYEEIKRLEGLMAYAEEHKNWDELERLKEQLKKLIEKME